MKKQHLAKSSLAVLAGLVLRQGGILVAFGILSRMLEQSVYGQFQRAWMVGMAISAIMAMGIPQSMQYFIPRISHLSPRRRAFLQSMAILQAGGIVGGLLVYFFAEPLSYLFCRDVSLAAVLRQYCFVIPFLAFGAQASAIFTSIERPRIAGIINGCYGLALIISLGGMAMISTRLGHLFTSQAVALGTLVLLGIVLGMYGVRRLETGGGTLITLEMTHSDGNLSIKRQVVYALPLLASVVVATASGLIARGLVSFYYSASEFAVFANGAVEIPIGMLLVGAVFSVVQPHLTRSCAANNIDKAVNLIRQASGNIAIFVFPAAVFLAVFSRDVMILLFGQKYADSGLVFMLFSIGMLPRIYTPYNIINATGKTRLVFYLSISSLVCNFLVCWLGIVFFGIIGLAIGTITQRFLIQLLFAWVAARAVGTSFAKILPWRYLCRILVVCIVVAMATGGIRFLHISPWLKLLLGAGGYGLIYLLVAHKTGVITPAHTEIIRTAFNKVLHK